MLQITQLNDVPSVGALLGSRGSQELLSSINRSLGSNAFFGSNDDRYGHLHQNFVTKFIEPIRRANSMICDLSARLVNNDYFRSLTTPDELRACPPCMMPSLLTHEPLYNLFRQGRVNGWGYVPEAFVDAREQYKRLVETNGTVWYETSSPNLKDGEFWDETTIHYGIDPQISFEDRIAIEETRDYIDKILRESEMDPTDLDELRG